MSVRTAFRRLFTILPIVLGIACAPVSDDGVGQRFQRPNILLIVADDLGYSDLGVFGSEIPTPTLNALAARGSIFTNFHTGPNCSPSRAMLLTGVDNHRSGLGLMKELSTPELRLKPGYEGYLNESVVTISRLLKDAGYQTLMAGKWHLGDKPGQLPSDRGFDQTFALMEGAGSHYNDSGFSAEQPVVHSKQNGQDVRLRPDFYSTRAYTDKMLEFLDNGNESQPFFAYLAYTAPHWPLQAPKKDVDRFVDNYGAGWDVVREERFKRQISLSLIPSSTPYPSRRNSVPAWAAMSDEERRRQARTMAVYAAMVSIMDRNIGEVFDYLEDRDLLENTVVVFLSDNGGEGRGIDGFPSFKPWIEAQYAGESTIGSAESFEFIGPGWGQVSVTPHLYHKSTTAEGGLRSPLIVSLPGDSGGRKIEDGFVHITDIAPTLLRLADAAYPDTRYGGTTVSTFDGCDQLPYWLSESDNSCSHEKFAGFEFKGHAAVYQGPWKALFLKPPYGDSRWQLFNLDRDQSESTDVALENPDQLERLLEAYESYAQDVGVVALP